jgi:carboxyl-terminal processing protease
MIASVPTDNVSFAPHVEQPPESTAPAVSSDASAPAAAEPHSRKRPTGMQLPSFALVWLLGTCVTMLPLCLGLVCLRRLGRSSSLVTGGPLQVALLQAMDQLGVKCSVRLLESQLRSMPMTWGIWQPSILLPAGAYRWSTERLRIVLLHELAHVQRRDCLMRLLAQLARAAYWFNPLAWLAERELRTLQERACDDLVLNRGINAADYAEHVLAVSVGYRPSIFAAGLAPAMARTSRLERRLLSILDSRQNRRPLSARRIRISAVAALTLISILSVTRFEAATAHAELAAPAAADAEPSTNASQSADGAAALTDLRAKITEHFLKPVDEKEMVQGAIKGMVDALDDPYSGYLTPEMVEEMDKQISGTRVGIGAQLDMHDGQIRVVTPLEDSPALKAGIQPGDIIREIDGQPTAGIELTEAVQRIVGPQGTTVRLKIGREGGQDIDINITRGPIRIPTVKGFLREADNRWSFLLDPAQQIGYVQLAQLGSATPQELRSAIESLKSQGLKGLILDLRFCPGGTLESAVAVAKLFLSQGTIVSLQSRSGEPTAIKVDASSALGDFPLVLLVNGETASAAEILAGALQDNDRAIVLGTRTLGKGSVQTLIKLEGGGGAIKLTTAQYRLPSGRNIDRRPGETSWGINPDDGYFLPLEAAQTQSLLERRQAREIIGKLSDDGAKPAAAVTAEWIAAEQADPQLAAALKTLTARVASGQFTKVSDLSAAEIELALKREDIQRRRVAVMQNLEQLDRELAALDKPATNGDD